MNAPLSLPKQALLVVGDIFFSSRLRDTLKHLGFGATSARSDAEVEAVLGQGLPALVIVDLTIRSLDAAELVRRLKASDSATRSVPLIAFAGHLEVERLGAAARAGADLVVTNGQISGNLPGLVASLGVADMPA
jgi:CheY-like chemotaxis protein